MQDSRTVFSCAELKSTTIKMSKKQPGGREMDQSINKSEK